jgi:hypothetical protein
MALLKETIKSALEANDLGSLMPAARADRKVVSALVRLAYDKETLVGARSIRAMGLIARELARTDPECLRETCRKLLWSLSDESGGIGWSAPEMLGEIVAADPKRFADIIPLLASVYETDEDVFRPGVLYALARVGEQAPERVLSHADILLKGLSDPNPLARVFALDALKPLAGSLGEQVLAEACRLLQALFTDTMEAWVYKNDDFSPVEVGLYAREISTLLCGTK